jgi:hypothetical protein
MDFSDDSEIEDGFVAWGEHETRRLPRSVSRALIRAGTDMRQVNSCFD